MAALRLLSRRPSSVALEIMDLIVDAIISLIVHWRVGLALFLSIGISIAMASWLPWFTGGYGLTLVLMGFGGGLVWQGSVKAVDEQTRQNEPP